VEIREATPSDAPALATLHMRNLPPGESEFTQLGRRVVERFYRNAVARAAAVAFCAVDGGAVCGAVLVTRNVRAMFSRALLLDARDAAIFVASAEPRGLLGAIVTKVRSRAVLMPALPEVVYLMVDARYRNRRIGKLLNARAHAWFLEQRAPFYEVNVHADNDAACRIYFGIGHRVVREYVKDGVTTYTLRKDMRPAESPE